MPVISAAPRTHTYAPFAEHARGYRELAAFAGRCVVRVEPARRRDDACTVQIALTAGTGRPSAIRLRCAGVVLEVSGTEQDRALATWDAMCRLERWLRARRR